MSSSALLCLVIAITDGDTLKARCGDPGAYQQVTVRLAEIDAPESRQPFGERSRQHLAGLCFDQVAAITLRKATHRGRAIGQVECRGADAGSEQVRAGMAWAFTKYLTDQAIKQAEDAARAARVGLWSEPDPMPPWEWRHKPKK